MWNCPCFNHNKLTVILQLVGVEGDSVWPELCTGKQLMQIWKVKYPFSAPLLVFYCFLRYIIWRRSRRTGRSWWGRDICLWVMLPDAGLHTAGCLTSITHRYHGYSLPLSGPYIPSLHQHARPLSLNLQKTGLVACDKSWSPDRVTLTSCMIWKSNTINILNSECTHVCRGGEGWSARVPGARRKHPEIFRKKKQWNKIVLLKKTF